jgi:hypothetical protein
VYTEKRLHKAANILKGDDFSMKNNLFKKSLSVFLAVLMVLSCWVWVPEIHDHSHADAAGTAVKDKFLFAYFTDNSSNGQTVHLAVSDDGMHYTALR